MSYPIDKYKFYTTGRKVIAVTTFAGKTVRGVAVCSDNDKFDYETGRKIAAARCNLKVCQKRHQRAVRKYKEAWNTLTEVKARAYAMESYMTDSYEECMNAANELSKILK